MKFEGYGGDGRLNENPEGIDAKEAVQDILYGIDLYQYDGQRAIKTWERVNDQEKNKVSNLSKFIQIASQFENTDYYKNTDSSERILDYIKSINDSYFISKRIETVKDKSDKSQEFHNRYEDEKIRQSELPPHYSQGVERVGRLSSEEYNQKVTYSKLDNNHGVIYSPYSDLISYYSKPMNILGHVDSFIKFDKDKSEIISLEQLLGDSGFDKEIVGEEQYFELLQTYRTFIDPPFRKLVEDDLGIKLEEMSVRTQLQFLNFISNKSEVAVEQIKEFCKTFGLPGLKTFLACEYGEEVGDKILLLGDKLPKETAKNLFAKYSEITSDVDKIESYLKDNFTTNKEDDSKVLTKIRESLLRRGKDLLVQFAARLSRGEDPELLTQELEEIKAEIILFGSTFKVLSEKGGVTLADISRVKLDQVLAPELTEEEKLEMEQIFKRNRRDYPPDLAKKSAAEFKDSFNSVQNQFYRLKYDDDLVAFMRLEELDDNKVYAGSLNARSEARGSAIGTAMLKAVLDETSKTKIIEAVVYDQNPMKERYLSEFNFKIVGEIPNYHGTGQLFYKLERNELATNQTVGQEAPQPKAA